MQIQPIQFNKQSFSQNWRVFCYDDETSKQRRNIIREHLEEPFKDYEIRNSGRLSEYELNQLIKSLVLVKPVIKKEPEENPETNYELLQSAELDNFEPLYGNDSYRASLDNLTKEQLEIIKQSGIKHIVDLRNWGEAIKYDGIEVFNFPILNINQNTAIKMSEEEYIEKQLVIDREMRIGELTSEELGITKEYLKNSYQQDRRELCDKFVKFIQTMQKENVLIGCEFGTKTTDYAIQLNYFFNPKADTMLFGRDKYFGMTMQRIYENLSQEDKEAMGWNEEFDKNFLKRLENHGYWIL